MKTLSGTIVSNKMSKTVVVEVKKTYMHKLYKKAMARSKRIKVAVSEPLNIGNTVVIVSGRPVAKQVHYTVQSVLSRMVQK